MSDATSSPERMFHGFSFLGEAVSFSLADAVASIEFDTGKALSPSQIDATEVYLDISPEHVNDMTNRVIEWRRMKGIEDIFLAEFDVLLPDGATVSFTMKQYLAATQASLPRHPFDIEAVRRTYKSLLENNDHRRLVYDAIKGHLNKHH